jgi:endonuclease/exonuclease/phosphatase family metal-dependent hydrolase
MTFNVRMVTLRDGANHWPNRASLCARVIRAQAPDLVGFQEMQNDHVELLEPVLGELHGELGLDASSQVRPEHQAVFWSPDRFELVASGSFYLSDTPDRWSTGWDAACPRVATWVRLHPRGRSGELLFCNTHLDREGELARREAARLIAGRLPRAPAEILAGDFNAVPGSPPHRLLAEHGFRDISPDPLPSEGRADGGGQGTFHGFRGAASRRIDWLLVRGAVDVESCRIVRDAEPPLYPSDHYPVVADLLIR